MGIFKKFKSKGKELIAKEQEEEVQVPWHQLNQMEQLDTILQESNSKPVIIFKHSTRCGISRAVLKMFERKYAFNEDQFKLYYLDLLQNRDISNEIAARLKIHHESPQLILLKDGIAVYNASHHSIEAPLLEDYI